MLDKHECNMEDNSIESLKTNLTLEESDGSNISIGSMFQIIHLDTYLQYLCLVCRYAEFDQYEADSEGIDHSLTLVHHLGQKWSLFLKDLIAQGMKTMTGISPHIDITKNLLVVRFKEQC
jgi:predicted nucleic-acid-binding Zn-ribbon protein